MSVKYVIENGKEYKVITLRGQQQWLLNGRAHREKGPAYLESGAAKKEDYAWWHREYVKINYFDENIFIVNKWYYINGKEITEQTHTKVRTVLSLGLDKI